MKLRSKVLATLIPLTVLFVIITNLVGANMITSEAIKNDEMEANEAVKRIGVGLENMESILTIKCGDYSYWDDTWSYLQTSTRHSSRATFRRRPSGLRCRCSVPIQ
jgi:sensor domain CHASE-containing protein